MTHVTTHLNWNLDLTPCIPDPKEPVVGEGDTEIERLALSVGKGLK